MQYGLGQSAETLAIEGELAQVQQRAAELHRERTKLISSIMSLNQSHEYLAMEIRPAPTGLSGAEQLPSKKKASASWYETDLDDMRMKQQQQQQQQQQASAASRTYVNQGQEERHDYENFDEISKNNPYEDDVQTVHSEGVQSSNGDHQQQGAVPPPPPPPLPGKRPDNGGQPLLEDMAQGLTLGDISEADDRVKKFYGIIPKDNKVTEIKTVRMVKRDSKERSVSKTTRRSIIDESGRVIEVEVGENGDILEAIEAVGGDDNPPPPLPRGNYQNLHDFLQEPKQNGGSSSHSSDQQPKRRGQEMYSSNSLPRTYGDSSSGDSGLFLSSPAGKSGGSLSQSIGNGLPKPNFKLGSEFYRKKSKVRTSFIHTTFVFPTLAIVAFIVYSVTPRS